MNELPAILFSGLFTSGVETSIIQSVSWYLRRRNSILLRTFKKSLKEVQKKHREIVSDYVDIEYLTEEKLAELFAEALSHHTPEEVFPNEDDINEEDYFRSVSRTMVECLPEEWRFEDVTLEELKEAFQITFERFLFKIFNDLGPEGRITVYKKIGEMPSARIILLTKMLKKIIKDELSHFAGSRRGDEELKIFDPSFSEPELFRKEGPLWIDFKEGYVVEREEIVNNIIERFNDGASFQLIIGSAASGKSVIARNVEHRYLVEKKEGREEDELTANNQEDEKCKYSKRKMENRKSHWEIFVIHANTFNYFLEGIREDIDKFNDDGSRQVLLILEDIHLNPWITNLILQSAIRKKNLKVLLTARPGYEQYKKEFFKGGGGQEDILSKCEKITLKLEDLPEKIIKLYEKRKSEELEHEWNIKEQDLSLLKEKGRGSLWLLAYFLDAYNPETGVAMSNVCEEVAKDIEWMDIKYGIEKIGEGKDTILSLAPLSLYEIPTQESFLKTTGFCYHPNTLHCLSSVGEIRQIKTPVAIYYTLPHSEIAKIYLETAQKHPRLINSVKNCLNTANERFGQKDEAFEMDIINLYLQTNPRNIFEVIKRLPSKNLKEILEDIQTQEKIIRNIKIAVDQTQDLNALGWCLSNVSKASSEIGEKLARTIDIDALTRKIDLTDGLRDVESCFYHVSKASSEIGEKLARTIDFDSLVQKIEKIDDLRDVGSFFNRVAEASSEIGEKLVRTIDFDSLVQKIDLTENLISVGSCLSGVAEASSEIGEKLVKAINFDFLVKKIDLTDDIQDVISCLSGVAEASSEIRYELVKTIDIEALARKIDQEELISYLGYFLPDIAKIDFEIGAKLVRTIDIEALARKINLCGEQLVKPFDGDVYVLVQKIDQLLKSAFKSITISKINQKIEITETLESIGSCLSGVIEVSSEIGEKLAHKIDLENLSRKINLSKSKSEVMHCYSGVLKASTDCAEKLFEMITVPEYRALFKELLDKKRLGKDEDP